MRAYYTKQGVWYACNEAHYNGSCIMACSYKIEMAKKFNHDGKDYIAVVISKRCAVRFEAEFYEFVWRDAFETSFEGRDKKDFEIRIESNDAVAVSLTKKTARAYYSANVKVLSAHPLMSPIICSSFKVDRMTWRDGSRIILDSSANEWSCFLMSSSEYEKMHLLLDNGCIIKGLPDSGIQLSDNNLIYSNLIERKVSPEWICSYEWEKAVKKFLG
jgi:hypothetical protein